MTRTTRLVLGGFAAGLIVMVAVARDRRRRPHPSPAGIPDPGPLVGWALPATTYLTQIAAVAVAGFLLAAVFLLPTTKDVVEGLSVSAVSLASRWAAVWSVATLVLFLLTVSDVFARPLGGLSFRSDQLAGH